VSAGEWLLLSLRLAHALAALVWLGGGVYYLVAIRPALTPGGEPEVATLAAAQGRFSEWARSATLVLLATGVVLTVDRLASGDGGLTYVVLLVAKIGAAVTAFWLAGIRPARRARRRPARRAAPEAIVLLGLLAYTLGVVLSSVYGRQGS
jgi:putative copper export protein